VRTNCVSRSFAGGCDGACWTCAGEPPPDSRFRIVDGDTPKNQEPSSATTIVPIPTVPPPNPKPPPPPAPRRSSTLSLSLSPSQRMMILPGAATRARLSLPFRIQRLSGRRIV